MSAMPAVRIDALAAGTAKPYILGQEQREIRQQDDTGGGLLGGRR